MRTGNIVKMAITLCCLGGSIAALYNVYHDNRDLRARAEGIACAPSDGPSGGGSKCAQLLGEQRTPFSQVFTFQSQRGQAATTRVNCTRALVLVGSYECLRIP